MKRPAFFLFSCLVMLLLNVSSLSAQDTTYFDANWNRTLKSRASFYHLETKSGNLVSFTDYWMSNHQKQNEGQYLNGKESGLWTWWFKTGQKDWEVTYVNGQKEGTQTHWYPSGKLKKKIGYAADKTDGPCIWWFENGTKELDATYKKGYFDGVRTTWHANGEISAKERYLEGAPIGIWTKYDESGTEISREDYGGDFGSDGEEAEENLDPDSIYILEVEPNPLNFEEVRAKIGYPREAIDQKLEGKVIVRILIDQDGAVTKSLLLKTVHPLLDQAVMDHLTELKFTPAEQAGKPIACWYTIPFNFRLSQVPTHKED